MVVVRGSRAADVERTTGLWPFALLVLEQIELLGGKVLKIEINDEGDQEGSDFLWGSLTPALQLSEGEYLKITQEFGGFDSAFGLRGCSGGDATWGDRVHMPPTAENAALVAADFIHQFSRKAD